MEKVIFYTKNNCQICEEAYALLHMLRHDYTFEIEIRDIYTNDDWLLKYQLRIPVIVAGGMTIDCEKVNIDTLEKALENLGS